MNNIKMLNNIRDLIGKDAGESRITKDIAGQLSVQFGRDVEVKRTRIAYSIEDMWRQMIEND